jgi:hypothetical protein
MNITHSCSVYKQQCFEGNICVVRPKHNFLEYSVTKHNVGTSENTALAGRSY